MTGPLRIRRRLISGLVLVVAGTVLFASPVRAQDESGPVPEGPQPVPVRSQIVDVPISEFPDVIMQPVTPAEPARPTGIPTHPVEILRVMGYWLVPFLAASVIAVWFTIERLVVLRRKRVIPPDFVQSFLDGLKKGTLDAGAAVSLCEKNDSPAAHVFLHGVRKWGRSSVEIEQAIIDGGERQVGQLRRHLRVINGVATVAPLLGLLGTVIGMIQSFNDIASSGAMGKADQLAAGIAIALLTTAFGLAIAIPALIVYMYLSGRVEVLVMEMDELSQHVVRMVSAEGLHARPAGTAQRTRPPRSAAEKPGATATTAGSADRHSAEPVST